MEKTKKVINCMSVEEVADRIPRLFNLMSLADVIPEGTTVYDTDSGDMLDLVQMIRGAHEDLQWLMDRAGIVDGNGDNRKCNGATGDDGEASKCNDDAGTFAFGFVSHVNKTNDAIEHLSEVLDKFHSWFDREVEKATVEDIKRVLNCGDPAIGIAERRLLEGVLAHKHVERIFGKDAAKAAIIHIRHN